MVQLKWFSNPFLILEFRLIIKRLSAVWRNYWSFILSIIEILRQG